MSCRISVFYPLLDREECLDIPETSRAHGVISFGSDTTVCFGAAPGAGGFVIEPWEAQEYGILPRHCALLWAGGKFRLEFDKRAGVYLNGSRVSAREFCNPFQDGSEAILRLGFPDCISGPDPLAPWFRITREDVTARAPSLLHRWLNRFKSLRWWGQLVYHRPYLLLLFIIALIAGITTLSLSQLDQRITTALPHGAIPTDLGRTIAPSVAAVGISCSHAGAARPTFHSLGTAWLYERRTPDDAGHPSRWLVTNAHVAHEIAERECPASLNSDGWIADDGVAAAVTKRVVALFPPNGSRASADATGLELEIAGFTVHPLHAALDNHNFAVSPGAQGQPTLANVYDMAAVQIDANQERELGDRAYLTLDPATPVDAACLKAPAPRSCLRSQAILPGRPLLVFGYPVENQPYLGQGVAAQPFEFRTTVQSRTNALSRTLPGPSTEAMPALYAFSARSSGGMSGGPVIASNGSGGYFVVGLVFAGTFVSTDLLMRQPEDDREMGPDATGDGNAPDNDLSMGLTEKTVRTSISDGAYAADVVSLDLLLDAIMTKSVDNFPIPEGQREMWDYWADRTRSLDQNHNDFSDRVGDSLVCTLTEARWKLDRSLSSSGGAPLRGESANRIRISHDGSKPVLVTARVLSASGEEILQLSVVEKGETKPGPANTFFGVNSVSYLPFRPIQGDIVIAGPLNADVEVEVWTTESANGSCQEVQPS